MPEPAVKPHPLVALRLNHKDAYDAVAMFAYLLLVYGWGLWIYPLGRDYAHLARFGEELPTLARELFAMEVRVFGENTAGYHLVNMALMYACMLLIYRFVNISVKGAWWFGSLAACLFMANPVHSEAMHNLSGVADLMSCLAGLAALTAYAWNASAPSMGRHMLAYLLAGFAAGAYAENAALGPVLLAYELLVVPKESRAVGRGLRIGILALTVSIIAGNFRLFGQFDLGQMFGPLYLIFYPIGFLPETVEAFHERPWTAWLAAGAVILILALIHRKAQRPILLFAIVGMAMLRLAPQLRPIDLTHMIGGGQLLLANVLFVLGLIVVVFRIMDHPRWRVPMISITTTLVIIFFAMQWRSIKTWHDAGEYVRGVQKLAQERAAQVGQIGVLPDIRYYRGAPVCLSDAILDGVPILPVHTKSLAAGEISVREWSERGGEVVVPSAIDAPLFTHFPNADRVAIESPLELRTVWGPAMPEGTFTVSREPDGALRVTIRGKGLPTSIVPGASAGEEPGREPEPDADAQQ
ncbi:MAG: hypothetical protein HUU46_05580 [Candidatus Hydrogenedentes bacterium]|nr:hypothetical protein [Candidatus Hydrogenedentota bacterium]